MRLDALAIGAHPDDVELGCGGTLALLVEKGYRVGILHLTSGERGTRGTVEERREEARHAGEILGAAAVELLDFGDGALRRGEAEEDALIEVFRRLRPELVLCAAPSDRHPDHGRAHRLVVDVAYYAGLRRRGEGEPHRPGLVAAYMQHDPFVPDFIVDVTAVWERKLAALAAYASQLHTPERQREEPETKVSSREFRNAIEARARHYGLLVGGEFGEPFVTGKPLRVTDPVAHVLPGPR
ncbi:MAG: bacillithiol biosynthesis deacetylase BshB1 [Thermoanaerobaculia bacterium]